MQDRGKEPLPGHFTTLLDYYLVSRIMSALSGKIASLHSGNYAAWQFFPLALTDNGLQALIDAMS